MRRSSFESKVLTYFGRIIRLVSNPFVSLRQKSAFNLKLLKIRKHEPVFCIKTFKDIK